MKRKEMINILEKYKAYVGFSDWTIILKKDYIEMRYFALVDINLYEKEVMIELGTDLKKKNNKFIKSVLIHELVHGRVALFHQEYAALISKEEEKMVNDLTRGLLKIK